MEKRLEQYNKKIQKLFDLYEFEWSDPKEINAQVRYSLAKMYSDEGTRTFLENAVKKSIRDMSESANLMDIVKYKSRKDTLMQILLTGKQFYTQSEKLNINLENNEEKNGKESL
jgi:hypothetical protein